MCLKAQGDHVQYLVQLGTGWFGFGSSRAGLSQTQLSCWDTRVHRLFSLKPAPPPSWDFTGSDLKCKQCFSPSFYIVCVIVSHTIRHQMLSNVAPQANWYKMKQKSATCCWQNSSLIPNHSTCLRLCSPEKPLILIPWSLEHVVYL